ncbi:MAG TPA: GNAT family N-acetyltransferase, partial [Microvirga sp.]|nr:GNAT family N-acetyltransferase [Microvirga sp.]
MKKARPENRTAKLEVRQATQKDVAGIVALVDRAYDRMPGYSRGMIRGQINNYPEGQFVALYEGVIAGYCATMRLDERLALAPHSWNEITNDGFGSRHDPTGDWLYGFEMCVDPDLRGVRIGQRLYDARKA